VNHNSENAEGPWMIPTQKVYTMLEMKLAFGMGSLRQTHKDFADVVELIANRDLDSSFARYLHKSLRPTFRELVHRVRDDG